MPGSTLSGYRSLGPSDHLPCLSPASNRVLGSGPSQSPAEVRGLLMQKSKGCRSQGEGEPRELAGVPEGAGNSFLLAPISPDPMLTGTQLPPDEACRWALAEPRGWGFTEKSLRKLLRGDTGKAKEPCESKRSVSREEGGHRPGGAGAIVQEGPRSLWKCSLSDSPRFLPTISSPLGGRTDNR